MKALRFLCRKIIHSKKFVPVVLLSFFFISLSLVCFFHKLPVAGDDSIIFYSFGVKLAQGESYSIAGFRANFFPPAYPYFLGGLFYVFGDSHFIIQFANVVLYTISLFLVYLISKEIFASEFTAKLSVLILALHPTQVVFIFYTRNEVLYGFVSLAGTLCLLYGKKHFKFYLAGGFLFGLACLIKPQSLFFPLVYFICKMFQEKKIKSNFLHSMAVYFILILTLLPWTIRNYYEHGGFVYICTQGGLGLLTATHPKTDGFFRFYKTMPKLKEKYNSFKYTLEGDRWATKKAIEYIKKDPIRLIKLWPSKFLILYLTGHRNVFRLTGALEEAQKKLLKLKKTNTFDYQFYSFVKDFLQSKFFISLFIIYQILFFILFIASVNILIFLRKEVLHSSPFPFLGIGFLVYLTVVYMVLIVWSRFAFTLVPWMSLYLAMGFNLVFHKEKNRRISH